MRKYRVFFRIGHVLIATITAQNMQQAKEYARSVWGAGLVIEKT